MRLKSPTMFSTPNGDVVVPRGAKAQIVIRSATKGNRFHGTSDLVLDLQSISVGGSNT